MSLPMLEFTIAPDSISVYNQSSGMYIYKVYGIFENTLDCITPVTPIKAIRSTKSNVFGEVPKFNLKHTKASHFTFAIEEYGDDDFTDSAIQSVYIGVILSDWYYQRCKQYKTMFVDVFDDRSKQRIAVFNFKNFIHNVIKNNFDNTIEHAIFERLPCRNYSKQNTLLLNRISDIVDDGGLLKLYIKFY